MKILAYCALVAVCITALCLAGCGGGSKNQQTAVKAVNLMAAGKAGEAATLLNHDPMDIGGAWTMLTERHGAMKSIIKTSSTMDGPLEVVTVDIEFAKGKAGLVMTFDEKGTAFRFLVK